MVDFSSSASSSRAKNAFAGGGTKTTDNPLAIARAWMSKKVLQRTTLPTTSKTYAALCSAANTWRATDAARGPVDTSVSVGTTSVAAHANALAADDVGLSTVPEDVGEEQSSPGEVTGGSAGAVLTDEGAEGSKTDGKNARKNMRISTKLSEFMTHVEDITNACFEREAGPPNPVPCSSCGGAPKIVLYRCIQCLFPQLLCAECCLRTHLSHPLHTIEEWNVSAQFWRRLSLSELGMVVNFGHSGTKCIHAAQEPRSIALVHEYGIHTVKFRFCKCKGADRSAMQLLRAGFWPATWERPVTAFAVETLREFSLLSTHCHATAMDFCAYLRRRADALDTEDKPDIARAFMIAHREYSHVTLCRRMGVEPKDPVKHASLSVRCPACPQPNINMAPDWEKRPEKEQFMDALYHAIDGNFSQSKKDKNTDPDDVPLTLGGAYFANERDVNTIIAKMGPLKFETSTCNKFGAMGYFGHWGSVSGTLGLSCARHMFVLPGGGVDLQKGERFINVDIAMVCGLRLWRNLKLHFSAYDIQCQYRLKLIKRIQELHDLIAEMDLESVQVKYFPNTLKALPPTRGGIGKFHAPAHSILCRYKWSFMYIPGSGQTDGEGSERIWSSLNLLAARTREMADGHRHDTINSYYGDMNTRRTHGLAKLLKTRLERALYELDRTETYLERLEQEVKEGEIGEETLDKWKVNEADFLERVLDINEHKDLVNPYEPRSEKRLTQREVMSAMTSEASKLVGYSKGLVGVVEEGVELQEERAAILADLAAGDNADAMNAKMLDARNEFVKRVDAWRARSEVHLAPLVDDAAQSLTEDEKKEAAAFLVLSCDGAKMDEEVEGWKPPEDEDGEAEADVQVEGGDTTVPPQKSESVSKTRKRRGRPAKARSVATASNVTPSLLAPYVEGKRKRAGGKDVPRKRTKTEHAASEHTKTERVPSERNDAWHAINAVLIELPSSHHPLIRDHPGMRAAVLIERAMRSANAEARLEELRTYLIMSASLTTEVKMVRGQYQGTRARNILKNRWKTIQRTAGAYRRARRALVNLGLSENDHTFKPLRKEDVKAFVVLSTSEQLGDSKRKVSWIWENLDFIGAQKGENVKEFLIEAYRVHWFRSSALRTRWWEEVMLLPEEMRRIVRFFKRFELDWMKRAEDLNGLDAARAAYARKQAFRYSRLIARCRFHFQDVNDVDVDALCAEVVEDFSDVN